MTDATVASRSTGVQDTASTTHTITKPTGLTATQGILICFTNDVATTTASTSSTGWTSLGTQSQGTTTNHTGTVFWAADATVAVNLVVTLTTSEEATWAIIVVNNPGTPEIAGTNGGSSTVVGCPTLTTSATGNYLAVEYVGTDSSTTTAQTLTVPSGFTNLQSQNPGITSSAATFTMERAYTAVSSIAPGNATLGSAEQWVAFTIGFPGVASGGGGGNTSPTVRSVGTGADANTAATSCTVSKPTGLVAGDYLLAVQVGDADNVLTSMTAPSGFVVLASSAPDATNNIPAVKIWGKAATSTDASATNFAFADAAAGDDAVVLLAITTGTYDTTTPVVTGTWTTQARTSTMAENAPSITGVTNALLLAIYGIDANGTAQTFPGAGPTGMTLVQSYQGPNQFSTVGVYSQTLTSTAATGTKTVSPTPSTTFNGWAATQILINPGTTTVVSTTDFFMSQAV